MVLLATMRLAEEAYGVSIRAAVSEAAGRDFASGSIYFALERLTDRGLVTAHVGEPTAKRGGRAKRYFRVTAAGMREVRNAQRTLTRLWPAFGTPKGNHA